MTLQDQCCTLDQAKRLKELGVEQKSLARYYCYGNEYRYLEIGINNLWFAPTEDGEAVVMNDWASTEEDFYSAFTVAELLEMIQRKRIFTKEELTAENLSNILINERE